MVCLLSGCVNWWKCDFSLYDNTDFYCTGVLMLKVVRYSTQPTERQCQFGGNLFNFALSWIISQTDLIKTFILWWFVCTGDKGNCVSIYKAANCRMFLYSSLWITCMVLFMTPVFLLKFQFPTMCVWVYPSYIDYVAIVPIIAISWLISESRYCYLRHHYVAIYGCYIHLAF